MSFLWGELFVWQAITFSERRLGTGVLFVLLSRLSISFGLCLSKQTARGCVPGAGQAAARPAPHFLAVSPCHSCQGSFSVGMGKGHSLLLAVGQTALQRVLVCPGDRCGTLGPLTGPSGALSRGTWRRQHVRACDPNSHTVTPGVVLLASQHAEGC